MSSRVELNLFLEVDILTAGTIAEVINSVLESLLYQRNQIPFVYKTYRYYVNKWNDDDEQQEDMEQLDNVKNFQVQRQRNLAKSTKDSISAMREAINDTFRRTAVKSLRFLFGGTPFTPKESYTIHIPIENVLTNHDWEQHRIEAQKLNETLISLLTNESLYSIFSQNLSPTNVYLEFQLFDNPMTSTRSSQDSKSNMYPKEFSAIPSSCKDIQINLIHKRKPESENMIFKCCKDLHIFEDNISPYLKNSTSPSGFYGGKKSNFFNQDVGWWESEVIVRGFKEQSIKGQNIWK
ncbi:uncharacterized protein LOC131804272 [Musca domestica]|uniref:Uncharacterized protein LOC131804272 n=1 Tax=Musca domestica TaxID=7370 RepID=A0A1I8M7G3_MUSDO|nr:uncharacterized protein LOC131804272 [Musca domestica]